MTRETEHPYRKLAGAAFVTLREIQVFVDDDLWEQVLGMNLVLPGGAEVDVDGSRLEQALKDIEEYADNWLDAAEHRPDLFAMSEAMVEARLCGDNDLVVLDLLIPLIINDVDLPPARILIRLSDLLKMLQRIDVGAGMFARGATEEVAPSRCSHHAGEIGRHQCRSCMRRFWMIRAREKGLIDG